MADDFKRVERLIDFRQCILLAGKVINCDVSLSIELFERIKQIQAEILRWFFETLCGCISVKILRLHVECSRSRLQFCLMNGVRKRLCIEIEITIPGLSLSLARLLTGEITTQCVLVLLQNTRYKAGTNGQRFIFINLFAAGKRNDFFYLQRFQIHDGQRTVNLRPARTFPGSLRSLRSE